MTTRLYVTKVFGGEIELTGFLPQKGTPFFDENLSLVELGNAFADGVASQGIFKLQDPSGEFPAADYSFNLAAHKHITWTEDAPGSELWLSRGRVSSFEVGRGKFTLDNVIEIDGVVDDCNVDLGIYAFTEEWERPQEAGWDRMAALRLFTLNGSSSTREHARGSTDIYFADSHLAPNTGRVTMPAKTYPPGTQPADVVRECADTEGKVYGVVIHHVGGSHLCMRYHAEDDHTVHPSPIKITDNLAEWDPEDLTAPVFEPHWEMGKATLWDSQEHITGLVSTWGPEQETIFVENSGDVDKYEYWIDTFSDSESEDATQALAIADAMLDYRAASNVTHRVSIIMLPEQVGLVTVGQSLQIKAAAAMAGEFLDTYQTRRIAELKWEPRTDGRYWAHMHLDRVPRSKKARKGSPPSPPGPPAPGGGNQMCGPPATIASGTGIFPTVNAFDCDDLTQWDTNAFPVNQQFLGADFGGPITVGTWRILQIGNAANSATTLTIYATNDAAKWAAATAFGPGADFTAAGWTIIANLVGLGTGNNTGTHPSATYRYWVWRATAGGGNSWAGFTIEGGQAGDTAQDIVPPGDETTGTAGCTTYACVDHTHAHPLMDTGGPFHDAGNVTFTPTGTIAATDVQAAIAEVAAEATGAPTTADYLVGTAQAGLSAEIVVGASPSGELGGTWASPTVDATHSGSAHVTTLNGLSDATITAPATDDDLRYNGSQWVNDVRKWEVVTGGEDIFVWDGDDLVYDWST